MVYGLEKFKEYFGNSLKNGGYKHREKSNGDNQSYYFSELQNSSFPKLIELFSKQPNNFELKFDIGLM